MESKNTWSIEGILSSNYGPLKAAKPHRLFLNSPAVHPAAGRLPTSVSRPLVAAKSQKVPLTASPGVRVPTSLPRPLVPAKSQNVPLTANPGVRVPTSMPRPLVPAKSQSLPLSGNQENSFQKVPSPSFTPVQP